MTLPTDPAVAAIGRALERTIRRVEALDKGLRALAGEVAELAAAPAGPPAAPRSWLLADDPDRAGADLDDLAGWLDAVYRHYPDAALSSCWLWHPAVVEELWWLRCAHAEAYHPETGTWLRVGDWHDRQRPGVARRVRAVLSTCELSRHKPVRDRARAVTAPARAPLTGHTTVIASAWTHPDRSLPDPTSEQLTESETYQ
ncbi:MAG: hypothetical protein L0K86_21425, partial [Actinomycetia bacterium]|nr:hypothetical protein [Actinomycetes bacterium]